MSQKIVVQNPVVELDGDEMTRIIWKKIREEVRSIFCPHSINVNDIFAAYPPVSRTRYQVLRPGIGVSRPGTF
jgi:isocitrate dehydrogenase